MPKWTDELISGERRSCLRCPMRPSSASKPQVSRQSPVRHTCTNTHTHARTRTHLHANAHAHAQAHSQVGREFKFCYLINALADNDRVRRLSTSFVIIGKPFRARPARANLSLANTANCAPTLCRSFQVTELESGRKKLTCRPLHWPPTRLRRTVAGFWIESPPPPPPPR